MKRILYTLGFLVAGMFSVNAQNVTTYIGRGTTGLSGTGTDMLNASLNAPYGVAIDKRTGNIYITEEEGNMVSIITNGKYYVRAGQFQQGGFADGAGAGNNRINSPRGIAVAADGTVYIVDGGNNSIRKLSPFTTLGNSQTLTTVAGGGQLGGTGSAGYQEDVGLKALFDDPMGIAIDPTTGDLIVADYGNLLIRRVNPVTGATSLVAGRPGGLAQSDDGNGNATGTGGATFARPIGVFVDANGDIYVTQEDSYNIRKISNGKVTTVADLNKDNILKGFDGPNSLVKVKNDWYFSMGCAVEKLSSAGATTIFAGEGDNKCGFADGSGTAAMFDDLRGIVQQNDTFLLAVDQFNNRIRRVSVGVTSGVKEMATIGNAGFRIYPNPAQDFVMIERKAESGANENTTLAVYDIAGREIVRENISASGSAHWLSLDAFQKGVYIIKLQSGTAISTSKLVVNK